MSSLLYSIELASKILCMHVIYWLIVLIFPEPEVKEMDLYVGDV